MSDTQARLDEIRARVQSAEPGSSVRHLGAVTLSCMDPVARDLMETALEQYRAFHARHLETIADAWRKSPEWGGMWESIGADKAYLFAYWLFRHSGLVDARARADVPWLLDQLEAHRAATLNLFNGTHVAGAAMPCASVAWDVWRNLIALIDPRFAAGPPPVDPEQVDVVAELRRHLAFWHERVGHMADRFGGLRAELKEQDAEIARLRAELVEARTTLEDTRTDRNRAHVDARRNGGDWVGRMTPHEIAIEAVTRMAHDPLVDEADWDENRAHVAWQIEAGDTQTVLQYQAVLWALDAERAACVTACICEHVDAEDTQAEGDFIYNRACEDCANAIRERGEG